MTGTQSMLSKLLVDCDARDIRMLPAGSDGLTIDAPQNALTAELLGRLKAHKVDLLSMLRPAPEAALALPAPTSNSPAKPTKAVCRCGCPTWRDVPIHGGQSVRRDCGRCGRFLDFPIWNGKGTLQHEQ